MSYEDYLPKSVPRPLRGPWGTRYFRAVGRRMDAVIQVLRDGANMRLPALAPEDALPYIGLERSLPRGPGETVAAYRARLTNAWDAWQGDNAPLTGIGGGGGTHYGLLNQLRIAGFPSGATGVIIVQQNGRYAHLDGAGALVYGTSTALMNCVNRIDLTQAINSRPGWTFDGRDNFYSVFGIVIPQDVVIDNAKLNAIVERWRPADTLYIGAWVINSGRLLGWPTGRTLATDPVLGGNTRTFYPGLDHQRIGYYA